jgi:hypothetical protein
MFFLSGSQEINIILICDKDQLANLMRAELIWWQMVG